MRVSVVVVSYRPHRWIEPALRSVREQADELVVVDNGSPGREVSRLAAASGARPVVAAANLGFPAGVNLGVGASTGDVIALLNDDAIAAPDWIASSVGAIAGDVAIVTPKLRLLSPYAEVLLEDGPRRIGADTRDLGRQIHRAEVEGADVLPQLLGPGIHPIERGEDGSVWRWTSGHGPIYVPMSAPDATIALNGEAVAPRRILRLLNSTGGYLSSHGYGGDYGYGNPDGDELFETADDRFSACGAAVVMTREAWQRVGPMAAHFFAYYEDLDWSWRAQLCGFRIRYVPGAVVDHVGGVTSGGPASASVAALAARNRIRCLVRNAPLRVARREAIPAAMASDAPSRWQVGGDVARALLDRRRLAPSWRRRPEDVWSAWAGVNERWPASSPS